MKLTILDAYSINPGDLSWAPIEAIGSFTSFERTSPEVSQPTSETATGFSSANANHPRDYGELPPT